MNSEARRSMRITELTRHFLTVYHTAKGTPTEKAEKAYRETLTRAKKYASPQTASEYLAEILERVGEKRK